MKKLRELLYRDRIELDDLFKEHALWEHLYNELYLDIVDRIDLGKPAIELLNDVYFLCIRVLVDKHPEDEFAKKFLDFELPISDEYSRESQVRLCLACAVLSLSAHRVNQNVLYFIRAVNRFFKGRGILEYRKLQQFLNIGIRFDDYRIRITPASPWELDYDYGPHLCEFWLGVMGVDFSERKIRWILSLYDKDEDKKLVFSQMVAAMEVDIAPREEVSWYDTISKELYGPQTDEKKMEASSSHEEEAPESYESLQRDNLSLRKENAELRRQLEDLNNLQNTLQKQFVAIRNANSTIQTTKELTEQEIEEIRETAKQEAIRRLVEAIVEFGENYPSSSNDKADVIRSMLLEKTVFGHIPTGLITDGLRNRINALGRKESYTQIGTMNVENLNDIHDNKTVNYGSKG